MSSVKYHSDANVLGSFFSRWTDKLILFLALILCVFVGLAILGLTKTDISNEEFVSLQNEVSSLKEDNNKLLQKSNSLEEEIVSLKKGSSDLLEEVVSLKDANNKLLKEITSLKKKNNSLKKANEDLQKKGSSPNKDATGLPIPTEVPELYNSGEAIPVKMLDGKLKANSELLEAIATQFTVVVIPKYCEGHAFSYCDAGFWNHILNKTEEDESMKLFRRSILNNLIQFFNSVKQGEEKLGRRFFLEVLGITVIFTDVEHSSDM